MPLSGLRLTKTGYVLRAPLRHSRYNSIAISHDVTTSITSGIVMNLSENAESNIIRHLTALQHISHHPFTVLAAIYEEFNIWITANLNLLDNSFENCTGIA